MAVGEGVPTGAVLGVVPGTVMAVGEGAATGAASVFVRFHVRSGRGGEGEGGGGDRMKT